MFKWSVMLLVLGKVLCENSQTLKYAEKRAINGFGVDYAFHQQQLSASEQQGLSAYAAYAQKIAEQPGELPKNVRTIIVTKKVPVPYPVQVEKKVPVPVKVPIRRPYPVYVPKPYYVEVMKQVPVPVKVPVPQPYTVEKHVPFPFKVHYDKPYPVHITKPYPVYYEKRVPVQVETPVAVPYKVHVDRPVPVNIPIQRPVYFPVERPYHFPVKVPVENPVAAHVHKPVPVPVTIEKPQIASSEHSAMQDYHSSTQPTAQSTFSPSPYDELTSTILTEGKHKVISFLPGNQDTFGSYGSSSDDIGTIHVSNIKGNGGNSSDWVPKAVPNHQYLTYIPSAQPKFLQYVPKKPTKLQEVSNAEPYVVKHGSVKMQYKLHYDPTKKEYSFQLVPKTQTNEIGHHVASSYLTSNGESKPVENSPQTEYVYKTPSESQHSPQTGYVYKTPSESQNSPQTEYVHKTPTESQNSPQAEYLYKTPSESQNSPQTEYVNTSSESQNSPRTEYVYKTSDSPNVGSNYQFPTKSENGVTYSYQHVYQGKPEMHSAQQGSDSPTLYYPREAQEQIQYKHESPYAVQAIDSVSKTTYDASRQMPGQIPEVTYSYQSTQNFDEKPQSMQQLSSDPHQVAYTYETFGSEGKIQYEPHVNPSGHVSYMYIPQSSVSHLPEGQSSNREIQYSISSYQNGLSTEYPEMLYQQGRIATILRDQYETTVPEGKIPENFKTSRTTESLNYFHSNNDTRGLDGSGNDRDDKNVHEISSASANENYQIQNIHPSSNKETIEEAPTSSIKFERFGVADVVLEKRTKLYPLPDSSDLQLQSNLDPDGFSNSTSAYEQVMPLEHYLQHSETSSDTTESPFSTKVNRLSSYKVPRSRRLTRTKLRKTNDSTRSQDQSLQSRDDTEKMTTPPPVEWYSFFGSNEPKTSNQKETNSHTGAAERAPFFSESPSTTSTTTTSNSLQPPSEIITIKPTQSLRTKSRGSVRAYPKNFKQEDSSSSTTTTVIPTTTTTRARRRRRPARRRMDRVTESPVEETAE